MTVNVLVIETFADHYARHLAQQFPSLTLHTSRSVRDVTAPLEAIDILVAFGIAIDDGLLRQMPRLRWIQSLATGVDHFLRCKSLKPETVLTSARGIHGPPMRETVARLMLALAFDAPAKTRNQTAHVWDRAAPWPLLAGKTAVIAGVGVSGTAVAQLLTAFGMTVIGLSRTPRAVDGFQRLEATSRIVDVVRDADWLINILPGAPENAGLFSRAVFDAMKPGARFLNVGRGETVDEAALLDALRAGRIAGAGLDAFSQEPLPPDSPFWGLANVIITPHVAGYVAEYEALVMPIIESNMALFLAGQTNAMRNLVPH